MLRVVAALMNLRSRLSGIATGDQAIFVRREVFEAAGGFPDQPLMEDIELSRRLLRVSRPACLRARVRDLGAALGAARGMAHHRADVAPALGLLARRAGRAPRRGLPVSATRIVGSSPRRRSRGGCRRG